MPPRSTAVPAKSLGMLRLEDEAVDLDTLGTMRVVSGRVVWSPPRGMSPPDVAALRASVAALNKMIAKGERSINARGEVK